MSPEFTMLPNGSCPFEPLYEYQVEPLFGKWTFYELNTYFSGACGIFATLTIWTLQILHATHFSRPSEQKKIIRVAHIIPAYSLISWFCVFIPRAYYYLFPWLDLVQSIALTSFFLLLCDFIAPSEDQRTVFFTLVSLRDNTKSKGPRTGLKSDTPEKRIAWYRQKWVAIFQYPVIAALVGIVTDASEATGRYCGASLLPKWAHLWMFLLSNFAVTVAVIAILRFYAGLKGQIAHHKPLAKLLALKLVVFLSFIQGILFDVLQSTHVMKPTTTLTYADVKVGIPTLVTCVEMALLSVFFHYAYSHREYLLNREVMPLPSSGVATRIPATSYQGGFLGWRAFLVALDPREALFGFWYAFQMANELPMQQRGGGKEQVPALGYNGSYQPHPHPDGGFGSSVS